MLVLLQPKCIYEMEMATQSQQIAQQITHLTKSR